MQCIFRIIQSVPSPKAEPFKMWPAKVAEETFEKETGQPVITSKNAIDFGKLIGDVAKETGNKEEKK